MPIGEYSVANKTDQRQLLAVRRRMNTGHSDITERLDRRGSGSVVCLENRMTARCVAPAGQMQ